MREIEKGNRKRECLSVKLNERERERRRNMARKYDLQSKRNNERGGNEGRVGMSGSNEREGGGLEYRERERV